jgi:hypothetical protein
MFPVIELRCETLALLTGWPKKVAANGPVRRDENQKSFCELCEFSG